MRTSRSRGGGGEACGRMLKDGKIKFARGERWWWGACGRWCGGEKLWEDLIF